MSDFKHTHLLGLLGVVLDGVNMVYVVVPYMDKGDLKKFITNEENVSDTRRSKDVSNGTVCTCNSNGLSNGTIWTCNSKGVSNGIIWTCNSKLNSKLFVYHYINQFPCSAARILTYRCSARILT